MSVSWADPNGENLTLEAAVIWNEGAPEGSLPIAVIDLTPPVEDS